MRLRLFIGIFLTIVVLGGIWAVDYLQLFQKDQIPEGQPQFVSETASLLGLQGPDGGHQVGDAADQPLVMAADVSYRAEEVVRNLAVPWSLVFTSPERMLVTERSGQVRQVINDELQAVPVHVFTDVSSTDEEGLMGMALHPRYDENKFVYFCYAYPSGSELNDRVVRFVDQGDSLANRTVIIESIPAARFHAGCELGFGPDEKLYITTGDATDGQLAQQRESLAGKILRLNDDGSIPADNPFMGSAIWSLGHRNPQGIDWHPPSGVLYSVEHGPSGFDGPGGGDEVNAILKGENYGWPVVHHEDSQEGMQDPKLVFTPAVAPGSGLFYTGDQFPEFQNNFFFAALRGEGIIRVVVDPENPQEIVMYERLPGINYGRIRELQNGPDGALYFTTSNRDGRGDVRDGDDKIYRLIRE